MADAGNWFADEIEKQLFPQTATWGLVYWEELLGLQESSGVPIEERRKAVMLKKLTRAPMNPAKIQNMLQFIIGKPCFMDENIAKNIISVLFLGMPQKEEWRRVRKILDLAKPAHLLYVLAGKEKIILTTHNNLHCICRV